MYASELRFWEFSHKITLSIEGFLTRIENVSKAIYENYDQHEDILTSTLRNINWLNSYLDLLREKTEIFYSKKLEVM